jgi:hypothetical protein
MVNIEDSGAMDTIDEQLEKLNNLVAIEKNLLDQADTA